MTSTPSTRHQLDGVAVWVLHHSIQSSRSRVVSEHPTDCLICAQVLGQSDMGGAADLGGFIVICGLQTLAIGYLAYN